MLYVILLSRQKLKNTQIHLHSYKAKGAEAPFSVLDLAQSVDSHRAILLHLVHAYVYHFIFFHHSEAHFAADTFCFLHQGLGLCAEFQDLLRAVDVMIFDDVFVHFRLSGCRENVPLVLLYASLLFLSTGKGAEAPLLFKPDPWCCCMRPSFW